MQVGKLFWQGRWGNYFGRAGEKIILAGEKIILAGGNYSNWIGLLCIRSSLYPITYDTLVTELVYYLSDQAYIP